MIHERMLKLEAEQGTGAVTIFGEVTDEKMDKDRGSRNSTTGRAVHEELVVLISIVKLLFPFCSSPPSRNR